MVTIKNLSIQLTGCLRKEYLLRVKNLETVQVIFFYETSEGFFFKSIDGLLEQEAKTKLIYNETTDSFGKNIPEGYDQKILKFNKIIM